MNGTSKKIEDIIDRLELSSDIDEDVKEEYDFNEIVILSNKISKSYEAKLDTDINNGKLDIRKKEIALDIFEKHLDNIIKNNKKGKV